MADILDFNTAAIQGDVVEAVDRVPRIKAALNSKAKSFVYHLLPAASVRRGEARVGSLSGEPGESLWVSLEGATVGVWRDHATDEQGGDLISLYAAAMNLDIRSDFAKILDELEGWLGWRQVDTPKRPQQLAREARKDDPKPQDEPLGSPTGTWHYLDEHSNIIATVYRYDLANGSKTYRPWDAKAGKNAMPATRPLYNLPNILYAEPVILVEGEKAADALIALGYSATTAMGGANAPVDKTDWTALKNKRVILWPDADEPGAKYARVVSPFLSALGAKVALVRPPEGAADGWDAADAVRDGVDVAKLINACEPHKATRFKFLSIDDLMALEPPEWVIDGFLPEIGLAVVYGPSGGGKTFVTLDMALSVAHGIPWHGKATKKRGVVYIAGEGAAGLGKRVSAWHRVHGLSTKGVSFHVLPTAVNMLEASADVAALTEAILQFGDIGVAVIDTLARAFIGGDENDARDMGTFVSNCDRVRDAIGGLVMPVHHTGKDKDKGARGSSALRAALETEISVEKMDGLPNLTVRITKQKDDEEGPPMAFRLQKVEVTHPTTGEVATSCVVMIDIAPVRRQKLGDTQQTIVDAMKGMGGMTLSDLETTTGKSREACRAAVKVLVDGGMISKSQPPQDGGGVVEVVYYIRE